MVFVSRLLTTWIKNTQNYESVCCFEWIQLGVPHYKKSVGYTDFTKMVLRTVFGAKREDVTWGWIKPHSDELRVFYTLTNIISSIKSRNIRQMEYEENMGRREYGVFVGHFS
jgi:hypothetical protein